MVTSRAFKHPTAGIALFPLLDMLNHGATAHVAFAGAAVASAELDSGLAVDGDCHVLVEDDNAVPGVGCVAAQALAVGEEVI